MESSMLNIIPQTKICTKCQIEKSVELFHKNKNKKDGLQAQCKECVKAYYQANSEAITEQKRGYCQVNAEKIAEYRQAYYQANREVATERMKAYYQANREVATERMKAYYQANSEKIAQQKKDYYQSNIGKMIELTKAYRQTQKGKAVRKNSDHKRRSITRQGDVTTQQLLELEQSAKVCYWCGVSLKGKKIHIDHYIPLSKGGEHTLSNLVVSCAKCNISKSSKDPLKFAQSVGKLF